MVNKDLNILERKVSTLMKKEKLNNAFLILSEDDNINSLICDDYQENCLIDYANSYNIDFSKNGNIIVKDREEKAVIYTHPEGSKIDEEFINNVCVRIEKNDPLGSSIEIYVIDDKEKSYPIVNQRDYPNKYFNKEQLKNVKIKIIIDNPINSKTLEIESMYLFMKDNAIL